MQTKFCAHTSPSARACPDCVKVLFSQSIYCVFPQPDVTVCWKPSTDFTHASPQYEMADSPASTCPLTALLAVTKNSHVIFVVSAARHLAGTELGISPGLPHSWIPETVVETSETANNRRSRAIVKFSVVEPSVERSDGDDRRSISPSLSTYSNPKSTGRSMVRDSVYECLIN